MIHAIFLIFFFFSSEGLTFFFCLLEVKGADEREGNNGVGGKSIIGAITMSWG